MSADLVVRAWWIFRISASAIVAVPAASEERARANLRATVCKERRNDVATWPLERTRVCSRQALERTT